MGFNLASIFHASLLILNALAILSEKRFLAPRGFVTGQAVADVSTPIMASGGFDSAFGGFGGVAAQSNFGGGNAVKQQVAQLLSSVRMLLRWPLIFINAATIVFALIFG